jgi:hypothetical protein
LKLEFFRKWNEGGEDEEESVHGRVDHWDVEAA